MNSAAIVHVVVGIIMILVALPLVQRRVKMNHWYGVRIPAAFTSEEAWFDINHYGGRLLIIWGLVIGTTGVVGVFLPKRDWNTYNLVAVVIVTGGILLVVAEMYRYGRKWKKQ